MTFDDYRLLYRRAEKKLQEIQGRYDTVTQLLMAIVAVVSLLIITEYVCYAVLVMDHVPVILTYRWKGRYVLFPHVVTALAFLPYIKAVTWMWGLRGLRYQREMKKLKKHWPTMVSPFFQDIERPRSLANKNWRSDKRFLR